MGSRYVAGIHVWIRPRLGRGIRVHLVDPRRVILMPLFMGMPAFAPLMMPPMRMVAMGSLIGHLVYGLILGASYVALARRTPAAARA